MHGVWNKTKAVLAGGVLLAALLVVAAIWSTGDRPAPVRYFHSQTPPRPVVMVPFDPPQLLAGLGDYVEGTAFGPDERRPYFHPQDGGKFHLYAIALR